VLRLIGRTGAYGLLFWLGAAVGAAGAFLQAVSLDAGPFPVPVGLVLALAGCAGLFAGGATAMRTRLGALVPALGWLVVVLLMTSKRPEGDVVLAQAASAYAYLFGGTLLAAAIVTVANALLPVAGSPAADSRPDPAARPAPGAAASATPHAAGPSGRTEPPDRPNDQASARV
jgi:Family of unknown function (DUF6113)